MAQNKLFAFVTVRQLEDEAFPRLVTDAAYARQVSASTSRSSPGFFGFDCSRARDFQSDEDRLDCHHEQLWIYSASHRRRAPEPSSTGFFRSRHSASGADSNSAGAASSRQDLLRGNSGFDLRLFFIATFAGSASWGSQYSGSSSRPSWATRRWPACLGGTLHQRCPSPHQRSSESSFYSRFFLDYRMAGLELIE